MATTRGPIPKRSEQRRRTNKPESPVTPTARVVKGVKHPLAKRTWHPLARAWYESLARSGQAHWYEPSDWAAAQLLAESMTRMLKAEKFSPSHFAAVWAGMTELLTTEGARRRVRMEVERPDAVVAPAGVAVISDYRRRLGAS